MNAYCYLYYVTHRYLADYDKQRKPIYSTKEIGIYSTKKLANEAVLRFSKLVGFRQYPNGFLVDRVRCYCENYSELVQSKSIILYAPYHEYYIPDEKCDYITRGRFYANKEQAEIDIAEWKNGKLFKKNPDGFDISEYPLNKDLRCWSEGFD